MKNKNLKILAFVMMIGGITNTQAANVTIGSFETGQYLVNLAYTDPAPTQSASGLSFTSAIAIGNTLSGDFASTLNWADYGWAGTGSSVTNINLGLLMTMTQTTNPNLNFTVTVFGTDYKAIQTYTGTTAGLVKDVQSFVALTPNAGSNLGGAPIQVIALDIGFDGPASTGFGIIHSIQSTVDLAAVPEPSVASLLALGTVGLVALRVRRKS